MFLKQCILFIVLVVSFNNFAQTDWLSDPSAPHVVYPINPNLQSTIDNLPYYTPEQLQQMNQGRRNSVSETHSHVCYVCEGEGTVECTRCNGTGECRVYYGTSSSMGTCPVCSGAGKKVCYKCHGSGEIDY